MSKKSDTVVSITCGSGTREVILETARRMFEERGYDATSLRQIAEAVGTTKAAVYYHFPAKEHLLLELTRPFLDQLSNLVAELRDDESDAEAAELLESYLDLFLAHLPMLGLLARDPATQNHPDVGQRARTLVFAVQDHIAGHDATDERRTRTACAMGVVHAVSTLPPEIVVSQRGIMLAAAKAALNAPAG
jgi:AcrR family transcriptional regulator